LGLDKALRSIVNTTKSIARRFGIGRALLRFRRAIDNGLQVEASTYVGKRRYLRNVGTFPPQDVSSGPVDCVMLLDENRVWEGLWSLYSFRTYFGPCRIIVLNDGTLTPTSIDSLRALFPAISIPDFKNNNREMERYLATRRLDRCRQWRRHFVFFRKLVDPLIMSEAKAVILLDSDCLHFRIPVEVRQWAEKPTQVRYIADWQRHSFCASASELAAICQASLPEYFCAGYLCVPPKAYNLDRIEGYLSADCFERQLSSGKFAHVAEQTLQAMEATAVGTSILPPEYATCPDPETQDTTMGHFCGGAYKRTWFYTKGLPLLLRQFQTSRVERQQMHVSV